MTFLCFALIVREEWISGKITIGPLISQMYFHSSTKTLIESSQLSLNFSCLSSVPSRRRGIRLPADTAEEMAENIILKNPATLTEFIGKFAVYMHVIA